MDSILWIILYNLVVIIILLRASFSHQWLIGVLYCGLNDSKISQVSRVFYCILANINNGGQNDCNVSAEVPVSQNFFGNLRTIQNVKTTIIITVFLGHGNSPSVCLRFFAFFYFHSVFCWRILLGVNKSVTGKDSKGYYTWGELYSRK